MRHYRVNASREGMGQSTPGGMHRATITPTANRQRQRSGAGPKTNSAAPILNPITVKTSISTSILTPPATTATAAEAQTTTATKTNRSPRKRPVTRLCGDRARDFRAGPPGQLQRLAPGSRSGNREKSRKQERPLVAARRPRSHVPRLIRPDSGNGGLLALPDSHRRRPACHHDRGGKHHAPSTGSQGMRPRGHTELAELVTGDGPQRSREARITLADSAIGLYGSR